MVMSDRTVVALERTVFLPAGYAPWADDREDDGDSHFTSKFRIPFHPSIHGTLARHAQFLARKGLFRTCLEVTKLVQLMSETDRCYSLICLDYYCWMCGEEQVQWLDSFTKQLGVKLPNLLLSRALSAFRRTFEHDPSTVVDLVDELLVFFPHMLEIVTTGSMDEVDEGSESSLVVRVLHAIKKKAQDLVKQFGGEAFIELVRNRGHFVRSCLDGRRKEKEVSDRKLLELARARFTWSRQDMVSVFVPYRGITEDAVFKFWVEPPEESAETSRVRGQDTAGGGIANVLSNFMDNLRQLSMISGPRPDVVRLLAESRSPYDHLFS
jgi:hypothetical protein